MEKVIQKTPQILCYFSEKIDYKQLVMTEKKYWRAMGENIASSCYQHI